MTGAAEHNDRHRGLKAASLLYHDVVERGRFETSGFQGGGPNRYKLELADFDEHLAALADHIPQPPTTVDELGREPSHLPWLLTFDDGGASAILIGDALAEKGWRGHFFVTTDLIGAYGFVSAQDIRRLDGMGHVIGSHSCSHPARMARCSWAQLQDEWSRSTSVLADIVGHPVTLASIPGGDYGDNVARAAAAAGIRRLFTSEPVLTVRQVDGCAVFGRFAVVRNVPPERAVALAGARAGPRVRQFASWQAKKAIKAVGGDRYPKLRAFLLNRPARKTSDD